MRRRHIIQLGGLAIPLVSAATRSVRAAAERERMEQRREYLDTIYPSRKKTAPSAKSGAVSGISPATVAEFKFATSLGISL